MKNLYTVCLCFAMFLSSGCAHSTASQKLDRSSGIDLSLVAKRYGVPSCQVSFPMTQEQALASIASDGAPSPESRPDWMDMSATIEQGDQLRRVVCLTKGYNGLAAGNIFYAVYRDGAIVAEMHPVIIN
ncbi:hypothetical protein LL974_02320 [Xanthomonas campestris pv. cannae]|nr:hypothetical protein [Xanthomonas campestris pv. cannae]